MWARVNWTVLLFAKTESVYFCTVRDVFFFVYVFLSLTPTRLCCVVGLYMFAVCIYVEIEGMFYGAVVYYSIYIYVYICIYNNVFFSTARTFVRECPLGTQQRLCCGWQRAHPL